MKPSNFIVRIPEPCHEDWNKMQPDAKGKFCNSCNKSVFDFSNKTDNEIRDILIEHKDQKVCGHFKKSQVNRSLNITINLNHLPRNISITKAFGIALFIVFGTLLFSCTDEKGAKIDGIEIVDPNAAGIMRSMPPPPTEIADSLIPLLTGEPIMELEQTYSYQNMVAGGISYQEIPVEPPPPPPPVEQVLGGLIAYSVYTPDTVPADSIIADDFKKIADQSQLNKSKVFNVYPNPGSGEFTIKYDLLKRSDVKITIFNMNGSLIKSVVNIAGQYEGQYHVPVNLNELPNGIYIVSFINGGTQSTERLVIAR
ncbi:MAG: T9SS type A sorting domain-containing protein [Bacteroidota bacterium]